MQRIKQLVQPQASDRHMPGWKAAIPVLSLSIAALAGCAQNAPSGPVTITADTVTTEPVAKFESCSRPAYPSEALARNIEGTVSMRFLVGADGQVREANVDKSSGNASLDEAARGALVLCSFTPGTRNGTPVPQWTNVQYVWKAS